MNYKNLKLFLQICRHDGLEVSWESLNNFKKVLRNFK